MEINQHCHVARPLPLSSVVCIALGDSIQALIKMAATVITSEQVRGNEGWACRWDCFPRIPWGEKKHC